MQKARVFLEEKLEKKTQVRRGSQVNEKKGQKIRIFLLFYLQISSACYDEFSESKSDVWWSLVRKLWIREVILLHRLGFLVKLRNRSDSSTSELGISSEATWSICSSELGYDDENRLISTILRNLTKTIYFWGKMWYNIYRVGVINYEIKRIN